MRLILEFLKPHWRLCAVTMALSLLDVGGALLIPTLVGDLINGATGGAIGFDGLLRTGVWMVVVATVSGIAAIAGGWVCAVLTARVGRDLREAVYRKSLTLSVSDFRAFGVSSFTTRTTSDVSNIRFALLNFFQLVVPVPVVFAFALALAFGKDWVLGALLAAVLAVICALSVPIVRQAAGIFRLLQKQLDRIATVLLENIAGVRVVRAFDKSAHEEARMEATFEDYRATGVQTVRLFAWVAGAYALNAAFNWVCVLLMASVSETLCFNLRRRIAEKIGRLPLAYFDSHKPGEVLSRVTNDLDRVSETLQNGFLRFLTSFGCVVGSLAFMAWYSPTLTALFCLFVALSILITDRVARANLEWSSERQAATARLTGLVAEHYTGREVIQAYNRQPSSARKIGLVIGRLAQKERMTDFLMNSVTPFIHLLSRLAQAVLLLIARVFLADPPMLILDEATSSVDTRTEAEIAEAMRGLMRGRTAFVIAHRLSTIRDANLILYMERGDITEKGTHEELLRKGGAYAALYASQFA